MLLDGAPDLALLPVEIAENHVDLERISGAVRGLHELFDRRIDLIRDEKIEAEHVVRRVARAPTIDPAAIPQLVALPGLADGETRQQRQQRTEENDRVFHLRPGYALAPYCCTDVVPASLGPRELDQLPRRAAASAR